MEPADSSLVVADPSWVHLVNDPLGPAFARAELDRLEAAIFDQVSIEGFGEAQEPVSDHDSGLVEAVEPPD